MINDIPVWVLVLIFTGGCAVGFVVGAWWLVWIRLRKFTKHAGRAKDGSIWGWTRRSE